MDGEVMVWIQAAAVMGVVANMSEFGATHVVQEGGATVEKEGAIAIAIAIVTAVIEAPP